MITIAGDNAFEFPVILSYDQCAKFIDVYGFPFKTVFKGPDLDPVVESAGDALPFLDDRVVLTAFNQQIPALELLENACKE